MRRLCLYINLLLLCCGLFGCGTNSLPRDEALPTAPPPETQATAVSENSVYFANSLEADRLYRLDLDTGGLERILDERCYEVCRQGNLVYFTNSSGLHAWDIAAGQRKTVQEGADYYEVVGDHLLYSKYQGDYRDDAALPQSGNGGAEQDPHGLYLHDAYLRPGLCVLSDPSV